MGFAQQKKLRQKNAEIKKLSKSVEQKRKKVSRETKKEKNKKE